MFWNKISGAWHWLLDLGAQVSGIQYPGIGLAIIAIAIFLGAVRLWRWTKRQLATPDSWLSRMAAATRRRLIPLMLSAMGLAGAILIVAAVAGAIAYSNIPDESPAGGKVVADPAQSKKIREQELQIQSLKDAQKPLTATEQELVRIKKYFVLKESLDSLDESVRAIVSTEPELFRLTANPKPGNERYFRMNNAQWQAAAKKFEELSSRLYQKPLDLLADLAAVELFQKVPDEPDIPEEGNRMRYRQIYRQFNAAKAAATELRIKITRDMRKIQKEVDESARKMIAP